MHRLLRVSILITFGMFIICIIGGCSEGSPEVVTDPSNPRTDDAPPPHTGPPFTGIAFIVIADPAPGGTPIPPNTQFSLIFDEAVDAVAVNGFPATGAGHNWIASPILPQGDGQTLNVIWTNRDGSTGSNAVGPYTVKVPETTPPRIMRWTVANGAVDVDPAPINAGGFRFDFDEHITGTVQLTDEAGADLNWVGTVGGRTATLTAVAGQELESETTYKIEIDVQDWVGNQLQVTITFVTKPK